MPPDPATPEGRPQFVEQLAEAVIRTCVAQGADPHDIVTTPVAGKMLRGDLVGWMGAFIPKTRTWYDVLIHVTRPGAEHLSRLQTKNSPRDDASLVSAMNVFLAAVQATHRNLFETGGAGVSAASSTLFSPPIVAVAPTWIDEAGTASDSQLVQLPHIFLICDFHPSPGVARVKPVSTAEVGDVLNEAVIARGQNHRIPLANRGVVLNPERLSKITSQLQHSQTLWVVEPSLLARRLHRN